MEAISDIGMDIIKLTTCTTTSSPMANLSGEGGRAG